MKANELRIGNYFMDRGGEVLRLDFWDSPDKLAMNNVVEGTVWHPLTEDVKHAQPITLTEEWLLKFGLVQCMKEATIKLDDEVSENEWCEIEKEWFYYLSDLIEKYESPLQQEIEKWIRLRAQADIEIDLLKSQKDIDPEMQKIINKRFFDMI